MPYLDRNHWKMFVRILERMYDFGAAMSVHDNMWAHDFIVLIHVA